MFNSLFYIAVGMALMGVFWFVKLAAQKGWGWAAAKLKAWWNAGKADLTSVASRVTALENDVAALKSKALAGAAAATHA